MENKRLPDEIEPVLEYAIKRGDLLVSRANTRELVGCAAVALQDYPWLFICDKIYRLTLKTEEAIPSHVAAYLSSRQARGQIELGATGASQSMQNISQDVIRNLSIPLPCVKEQQAIANFLDRETAKIDALVSEQQRLIELLQEKRQAVISHAVTKGLNPNAPMKDSGVEWLGEVPEHWEIKPLKRLTKIENSGCYGEEEGHSDIDLPVATTAQIDPNGRFLVEKMSIRSFTLEEAAKYSCEANDILVVKSSGSATNIISGKAGLVDDECEQFVFSNFLLRVKPLDEHSAKYIYYLLRSSLTRSRVEKMCSTTTYPNLQVGIYCSAHLPVPPLEEQREIARYIDTCLEGIDNLVEHDQTLIDLARERRSALISAAVTGQIDVRGLVEAEAGEQ
jgi:type I restriction enzyme S subunit